MDCSEIQAMIEPFLNNELNDADKDRFITHVRGCKACHEELEVYHVIYSVVKQLDDKSDEEILDYRGNLEQKLTRTQGGVRRRRAARNIIAMIILSAVLIAFCFFIFYKF